MFIQYDITSVIALGIDDQILFQRKFELEVKDAGGLCWSFELKRCEHVSYGEDCLISHSWGADKSVAQREKDEADMQREAEVSKYMMGAGFV